MLILLILATITLPQPSQSDLNHIGALLCGEACGMNQEAVEFIARQLRHDWYSMGTHGLARRWYAPLKPSQAATEIVRRVFDEAATGGERCRLVGNGRDVVHWLENGYLAPGAMADYRWESGGMSVSAFDCHWQGFRVQRWECGGEQCPR